MKKSAASTEDSAPSDELDHDQEGTWEDLESSFDAELDEEEAQENDAENSTDEDEDADEADAEDDDEDEAENSDEEDEDDAEDSDDAEDEEDDDSEEDAEEAKSKKTEGRRGLEDLPKWAQERISKQSNDIRKLRDLQGREVTRLAPRPDAPLAHVATMDELRQAVTTAKLVRSKLTAIREDDWREPEKEGEERTVTVEDGGQRFVLTESEVEAKLALANERLDPEAIEARRQFVQTREQLKPWERAEQIVPDFHDEGSPAQALMKQLTGHVPAIRNLVPDIETLVAHATRSMAQDQDTAPTKDFPKGRFKWVRVALDKDGKPMPPKRAAGQNRTEKRGKAKPHLRPPEAGRPRLNGAGRGSTSSRHSAWQQSRGGYVDAEALLDED